MVRCITPALEKILAAWKQEPSPYDDVAYDVPTYQRGKLLPEAVKKQPRCATPAMDKIRELECEFDRRIAAGETEETIIQSWKDRTAL